MTSPSEKRYVKQIAKKLVKFCESDLKHSESGIRNRIFFATKGKPKSIATTSIKRIAQTALKLL